MLTAVTGLGMCSNVVYGMVQLQQKHLYICAFLLTLLEYKVLAGIFLEYALLSEMCH